MWTESAKNIGGRSSRQPAGTLSKIGLTNYVTANTSNVGELKDKQIITTCDYDEGARVELVKRRDINEHETVLEENSRLILTTLFDKVMILGSAYPLSCSGCAIPLKILYCILLTSLRHFLCYILIPNAHYRPLNRLNNKHLILCQ